MSHKLLSPCKHVETLKLNGNQLFGTFPDSLGNLISLEVLDLGDNLLTGIIPPVLANFQLLSKFFHWATVVKRKLSAIAKAYE